jgi:hypothetical protein
MDCEEDMLWVMVESDEHGVVWRMTMACRETWFTLTEVLELMKVRLYGDDKKSEIWVKKVSHGCLWWRLDSNPSDRDGWLWSWETDGLIQTMIEWANLNYPDRRAMPFDQIIEMAYDAGA